jgi:hypothetical protein
LRNRTRIRICQTNSRWNSPGDPPFYVIEYSPKKAKGVVVEVDPTTLRFRPTGYPSKEEALARAFEIMDNGGMVKKVEGLGFCLSKDEVKKAYAQRLAAGNR